MAGSLSPAMQEKESILLEFLRGSATAPCGWGEDAEPLQTKSIPFFKTGEAELVAAGKVFAKGGVAITAIRKWRKADPEIYGIEIACMVRRDGKWRLITNFEDFRDRINKLDNDTLNVFNKLEEYYWDYKKEHVEIVRKRKNARFY